MTSKKLIFQNLKDYPIFLGVGYDLWNNKEKLPLLVFRIWDESRGRLKYTNKVSSIFFFEHVINFFLFTELDVISSSRLCPRRVSS